MRLKTISILLVIFLALGGYFYVSSRPKPAPPKEPQLYVWLVDDEKIEHIKIALPREGLSQAFIRVKEVDKFPWYFDDSQRSSVNVTRWGGGITLLLSGPGTDRVIARNATPETLAEFGLTQPQMVITIIIESGDTIEVKVGDRTPNGTTYYVQAPGSNDVALVDYTWYFVMERLVKEPPYVTQ